MLLDDHAVRLYSNSMEVGEGAKRILPDWRGWKTELLDALCDQIINRRGLHGRVDGWRIAEVIRSNASKFENDLCLTRT